MENKRNGLINTLILSIIMLFVVIIASYVNASPTQYDTVIINLSANTINVTFEENALNDSSTSKNITFFVDNESNYVYITIPKNATVTYAKANLTGYSIGEGQYVSSINITPDVANQEEYIPKDAAVDDEFIWVSFYDYGDSPWQGKVRKYHHNGTYTGIEVIVADYNTGIAVNNTHFWISFSSQGGIRRYLHDGTYENYSATFPYFPFGYVCAGITTNSSNIWCSELQTHSVRIYDMEMNSLELITLDSDNGYPWGICIDDDYMWTSDYEDDVVYKYYRNGTYTGTSWSTYVDVNSNTFGMACNDTTFWVISNPDSEGTEKMLNLFSKTTGDLPTDVQMDVGADANIDYSVDEINASNSPIQVDLNITAINNFLSSCTADSNGRCNLEINITSSKGTTKLQIDSINVTYDYNISALFSQTSESDIETGIAGAYMNRTTQLNSTSIKTQNTINVTGYYLNYTGDVPTSCTIDGVSGTVTGTPAYCEYNFYTTVGSYWSNHSIFWSKGIKITKTEGDTVIDTELNADLRIECSGYGTDINYYYWNTTLVINNTDSINYTNVTWGNYLEGASGGYEQAVLSGNISDLENDTVENVTSRYKTSVLVATESVERDDENAYEKQIKITALTGIDQAFYTEYYVDVKANVSVNGEFTNYNLYVWNGVAWELHTETVGYGFDYANSYATWLHNASTSNIYYAVSSETPVYDPSENPGGGGGGGGEPTVIIVSGNWTILQPDFYLLAAPGSTSMSYITIDNKANLDIEEIGAECIPSTCREDDPCSCVDLCPYVRFGNDLIFIEGKPLFQTYQIKPGQSGKLPFVIDLTQEYAAENNLQELQSCFYSFSIAITVGEVTKPISVSLIALPGMGTLNNGLNWLQGSTLVIPGPYPIYIPNWLILIILILGIIILIAGIYKVMKKPKKRVVRWW